MTVRHKREAYRFVAQLLALALREEPAPLPPTSAVPEVREALEQIRQAMLEAGTIDSSPR